MMNNKDTHWCVVVSQQSRVKMDLDIILMQLMNQDYGFLLENNREMKI